MISQYTSAIKRMLQNEQLESEDLLLLHSNQPILPMESDATPLDLFSILNNFIRSYQLDQQGDDSVSVIENLKLYFEDCEYSEIIDETLIRMKQSVLSGKSLRRDDRIMLYRLKLIIYKTGISNYNEGDYEMTEDWVIKTLVHFYILGIEMVIHIHATDLPIRTSNPIYDTFHNGGYTTYKPLECIQIDQKGNKAAILVERNLPTLSLDDFVSKLIGSEGSTEEKKYNIEEPEIKTEKLEDLRERDEFRDNLHTMKGNRLNKG